jgi:hypothetical protein
MVRFILSTCPLPVSNPRRLSRLAVLFKEQRYGEPSGTRGTGSTKARAGRRTGAFGLGTAWAHVDGARKQAAPSTAALSQEKLLQFKADFIGFDRLRKVARLALLCLRVQGSVVSRGREGSAEIVRLQHAALHRIVRQRRKCHTFAARPIPFSLQNPRRRCIWMTTKSAFFRTFLSRCGTFWITERLNGDGRPSEACPARLAPANPARLAPANKGPI